MKIIGISAFFHDSSASLIVDGKILNAVQEERFTRIKHDPSFPINSIKFLLNENKLNIDQIDNFVFYEKPLIKLERILETHLSEFPFGFSNYMKSISVWMKEKLFIKNIIIKNLKKISKKFNKNKLLFVEHHLSHAASAFYPSPFSKALILTVDGVGEWSTTTLSIGNKNHIEIVKEINFPPFIRLTLFIVYLLLRI